MAPDVHLDPFVHRPEPTLAEHELEKAWFDAPRRSSRPPPTLPPSSPPIDDPVADEWFR